MEKMYDWVPFFEELVGKMILLREQNPDKDCLGDIAKHFTNAIGEMHSINNYGEIDPFSFLNTVSNTLRNNFSIVQERMNITTAIPTDTIRPWGNAQNLLFHFKGNYTPMFVEELWELFDLVHKGETDDQRMSELFSNVLKIGNVKVAKLTQTLCLINPHYFIAIDHHTATLFSEESKESLQNSILQDGLPAYLRLIQRLRDCFRGCELYELNRLAYAISGQKFGKITPDYDNEWYQISSQQEGPGEGDFIDDWFAGSYISMEDTSENAGYNTFEGLKRGTIVIARNGMKIFHGLAIILEGTIVTEKENNHPQRHVVWIIKDPKTTMSEFAQSNITEAPTKEVYNEIRNDYPEAWEFLKGFSRENIQTDNNKLEKKTVINKIGIDNFRCFTNFTISLNELQLWLGDNGSGKTSVLDALRCIQRLMRGEHVDDIYGEDSLTAWDKRNIQTFKISMTIDDDEYIYELKLEYSTQGNKKRIIHEELQWKDSTFFLFDGRDAHLYRINWETKVVEEGAVFPAAWSRSTITTIAERSDNWPLHQFRKEINKCLIINPIPLVMKDISTSASHTLHGKHCEDFASWYQHILQEHPNIAYNAKELLTDVLPGFEVLSLKESGSARILTTVFHIDNSNYSFGFKDISDGQRQLIVLYMILEALRAGIFSTILVDEPDNFMSLREVQPWINTLGDVCADHGKQAIIISHHPEIIDETTIVEKMWFSREDEVYAVVKPFSTEYDLFPSEVIARGWVDE